MSERIKHLFLLPLGLLLCACSNNRATSVLRLEGNPRGPANYEFKNAVYRETPSGSEFLAYGLAPFYNSPTSLNYDSKWPIRGFVTFWFRATPISDGRYAVALLGPAKSAGPGDDEILSAIARPGQYSLIQTADGVQLAVTDLPMKSRNRPDLSFTLRGVISSTLAAEHQFAKQLDDFTWVYNSRVNSGPAPPPFPPE